MANTIAHCVGIDHSGRVKSDHRLGSNSARGEANTWRTFTTAFVAADGSGFVKVERDGKVIHTFYFDKE